jgi:MFS family permease
MINLPRRRSRGAGAGSSRALVPLLLFVGLVTAIISSLGAPLLPLMARQYGVTLGDAQWSLTATVLVGAIAAPIIGRLSDGPHRRTVILASLAAVVLGSVIVAAAPGFAALITGRSLQGLGLGLVAPAMATAREHLPEERARTAIASLSIVAPAGVGFGYPLSAWIAENGGLHADFWFGAAVSAVALGFAAVILPAGSTRQPVAIDRVAAIGLTIGLLGLLIALSQGSQWSWDSPKLLVFLLVGCVALALWTMREIRTASPLLNLRLLNNGSVLAADAGVLILGAAMYTLTSVMTDFVQAPRSAGFGFGGSVMTAGLLLLPSSFVMLASNRFRIAISGRVSDRFLVPAGAVIMGAAIGIFIADHSALWTAYVTMIVSGLGLGLTFAAMPGLIVRNVPAAEVGSALGLYTVSRFVGYSLGSALSAAILGGYTAAGARNPAETGFIVVLFAGLLLSLAAAALTGFALRPATSANQEIAPENLRDSSPEPEEPASRW